MKFLVGEKADFIDFLNSIGKRDRIAILSHNDLDGIGSSILIGEILKSRGLERNVKSRRFLELKQNLFSDTYPQLEKEKISTLFISDLNAETADAVGFEKLRKEFRTFLIDHHPLGKLENLGNVIKAETTQCAAYVCYELGKEAIDAKKWKWLACASLVSDVCYRNPEILAFIQEAYPEVTEENIHESEIGKISSLATSSLIYFADNPEMVYELIKKQKLKELEKYDIIVREEMAKWMKKYKEEAEYFPERNLFFYYYTPKFNITSVVTNLLSSEQRDATFISVSDIKDSEMVKVSARNSNSGENMIELLKKGMRGLDNAISGGHVPAAGGSFMKKDIDEFERNILKQ